MRPNSVSSTSRLLRGTYASKGKTGSNPFEEDPEGEDEEDDRDQGDQIKSEIEKLEDKIQKLGGVQSCGWDPSDHKDFLRVRTKHKERMKTVAFMTEMRRAVPTADE
jgi:hypothetical protein